MIEDRRKPIKRHWVRRHSIEARLLLAEGWHVADVADWLGFSKKRLNQRIRSETLRGTLTPEESRALSDELREIKARETAVTAVTGSIALKRACDELDAARARELTVKIRRASINEEDAGSTTSLKQIQEMSDDELIAYVESLVPELETKSC
ncbi:MAG: hypothetical protein AAF296_12535 [Pseudomonadota bacterium]